MNNSNSQAGGKIKGALQFPVANAAQLTSVALHSAFAFAQNTSIRPRPNYT
jgi:hypothetical protein